MQRYRQYYTILFHLLIWSSLIVCVLLLGPRPPENSRLPPTGLQVIWSVLPLIGVFYAHAYWLMPRYLFRKKKGRYFLLLLLLVLVSALFSGLSLFLHTHPAERSYIQTVARRLVPSVVFVLLSASLGAFRDNWRLEREKEEKETEHLRTELSFLRGQVNPHFMLNVLNSMVLMARKRSEMLEPALLELAGLMNYMLYDTVNEKISLEEEIEYLRVYIDLQMLRFGDDVEVIFNTASEMNLRYIEPMLLIPVVENAFKHGIGLVESPVICIDIGIAGGDCLSFTVKNKFNRKVREETLRPAGIGLINLRKRLELIYPGRYRMNVMTSHHSDITRTEDWYELSLNIPLE